MQVPNFFGEISILIPIIGFLPLIPLGIAALSGLGGMLGNREQTTKSTQNTQTNANNSFANANTTQNRIAPDIDPASQQFYNQIRDKYTGLMNNDPNMAGYTATGIQDINRLSDLEQQSSLENMAQRGQTGPIMGAMKNAQNSQRFGNIARFKQGIPLMARQLQEDTLGKAIGAFSAMPKGQYTENFATNEGWGQQFGNQGTQGTNIQPGNMAGGGVGGFAAMLAQLFGQGAFGGEGGGGPTHPPFSV